MLQSISDLQNSLLFLVKNDSRQGVLKPYSPVTATERQQSRKATTTESERLETRQRGGDEAQTGNIKRTPLKPDSAVSRGRARSQGTVSAAVPVKRFRRFVFFHSWRRNDNSTRMSWGQPHRTGHPCSFFSMVATRTPWNQTARWRPEVKDRQQNADVLNPDNTVARRNDNRMHTSWNQADWTWHRCYRCIASRVTLHLTMTTVSGSRHIT